MSRAGRRLRNLVLLSLPAIVIAGGVTEGVLRGVGYVPYYLDQRAFVPSARSREVYELRAGFRGLYAGVPITINSYGFRGHGDVDRGDTRFGRIEILGDSVAFGQGVREGETLADQLESALRKKTGDPVSVLNFGVPGYDTCQEYERFVGRGLAWSPQAAILLYYENDTEGPVFQVENGVVMSPDVRSGWFGRRAAAIRKASLAYNLVWTRWQVIKNPPLGREAHRLTLRQRFSGTSTPWQASKTCLIELAAIARERSVRFIVVPFPVLDGLNERPYPYQKYIDAVCGAASGAGVECLDVVPVLQDPRIVLQISPVERHPTAEVYRRIADRLLEILP